MFFASTAQAADPTPAPPAAAASLGGAIPMILVFAVFYLLIIRPNQKKISDHDKMVKALRRGDKVVTAGGIIGVISKVEDDNVLVVEIADEVKIRVVRDTITSVVNKTIANDNTVEKISDKDKLTSK